MNQKRWGILSVIGGMLLFSISSRAGYVFDSALAAEQNCGGVGVRAEDHLYQSNTEPSGSLAHWIEGVQVASATAWIHPSSPTDTFTLGGGVHAGPRGVEVDASGHVYVSAYDPTKPERAILVFDENLGSTSQRLTLDLTDSIDYRVYGITLDASGHLYVLYYSPNHNAERVKVFDAISTWPEDHQAVPMTTLDVGPDPAPAYEGIRVRADGSVLWVAGRATRTVERYTGSPQAGYTLDTGFSLDLSDVTGWQGFKGMDLSADETKLFIADDTDGAERILIVDPTDGTILPESFSTTGQGASNPFDVEVDEAGNVYVAQYGDRRVEKYVWQDEPPTPTPTASPTPGPAEPEVRGLWVTRWDYTQPSHVQSIMANAAAYNFNLILFQVRGNATVFYQSSLEPWAWELTGSDPSTLGTDPGWNPLALACTEAHARGMELHAYMNVFPAWKETVPPPTSADQLWNTHRSWFMQNSSGEVMWPQGWWDYWYTFIDPGVPEVKQYLHDVFLEVARNYDVDGIHYDYIRYPHEVGDWAYNATSVARFVAASGGTPSELPTQWAAWKRDQISEIVDAIYPDVMAINPNINVSAAVQASWSSAYNTASQNYRAWLSAGTLDSIILMLYIQDTVQFRNYVRDHVANSSDRWVVPGLGAHNTDTATLLQLIQISREEGAEGVALFSYSSLFPSHSPNSKANAILDGPFSQPAPLPPMPWKEQSAPAWRAY
jgi:uncharacterized lipoprotein YddW (UPF0748 family)